MVKSINKLEWNLDSLNALVKLVRGNVDLILLCIVLLM